MEFLTEKQKIVIDKFRNNVKQGKRGTDSFTRIDYQHLETIRKNCRSIMKHHEKAKLLYVYLDEN